MEATQQTETFKTIDSIMIKLDRLAIVLKPITCSLPLKEDGKMSNTELQGGLDVIEGKVTALLNTIQL